MLAITYCNADVFSKFLFEKMSRAYVHKMAGFLSQCQMNMSTTHNNQPKLRYGYPDLVAWIGRAPPDGKALRDLLDQTSRSSLTLSGISDYDRHRREIQSVTCKSHFSHDHSFEIVKNYPKNLGARAVWNVSTDTGEIASCVLVKSTACGYYAHAAECLARRQGFSPKVMYSDIWPHGKKFWGLLFGPKLLGRLGLFHFLQRIIRTLRDSHCDYWAAIRDLRACIFRYHDEDEKRLLAALKAGKLSPSGQKFTDSDIEDLKLTRRWKTRYDTRLRKIILTGDKISTNLTQWFVRYKVRFLTLHFYFMLTICFRLNIRREKPLVRVVLTLSMPKNSSHPTQRRL